MTIKTEKVNHQKNPFPLLLVTDIITPTKARGFFKLSSYRPQFNFCFDKAAIYCAKRLKVELSPKAFCQGKYNYIGNRGKNK